MVGAGAPQAQCHYKLGMREMAGSWGWMDACMHACCGSGKVGGGKMGDGWADGRVVQGRIGVGDMDGCWGDGWVLGDGWRILAI